MLDFFFISPNTLFIGLEKGECTEENLQKAKFMVPKSLEKYVERTYYLLYMYLNFTRPFKKIHHCRISIGGFREVYSSNYSRSKYIDGGFRYQIGRFSATVVVTYFIVGRSFIATVSILFGRRGRRGRKRPG